MNIDKHGFIKHKRNDDSIYQWRYSHDDDSDNQADDRGSFGNREAVSNVD